MTWVSLPAAGPFEFLGAMEPLENPEELVCIPHVETHPIITDEEDPAPPFVITPHPDIRRLLELRILQGVREEVYPDLLEDRAIAPDRRQSFHTKVYLPVLIDDFVKSQKHCHSRGGGSPEQAVITGFPPPRE